MSNELYVDLGTEELQLINGGVSARSVVSHIVGGAGAVAGFVGGYAAGSQVVGTIFYPIVAVPAGIVTGAGVATVGYYSGKAAGAHAYDVVVSWFK